jgi:nitrogen fixation NifU-like protein
MAQDPNSHPDLASLYRTAIRRHASAPVGYRQAIAATHRHEEYNPQCGDRIELQLQVDGDRIEAAAFVGEACAICIASASLLCSLAPGRTVAALLQLGEDLQRALQSPAGETANKETAGAASAATGPNHKTEQPRLKPLLHGDLRALLGVRPYPSRIRCATLPWAAAQRALSDQSRTIS